MADACTVAGKHEHDRRRQVDECNQRLSRNLRSTTHHEQSRIIPESCSSVGPGMIDLWADRPTGGVMDEDLDRMSRDDLIAEAKRLRQGIRAHRDSTGHELCWHQPALWRLLPEQDDPLPVVPEWPQFLRGCIRYRQSLDEQLPHAPRSSRE